ncbi:MAG: hypothetical protein AB7H90_23775 [Alphaproteobacteria bacterium]
MFGWGPLDLFGCGRDRPLLRRDKAGLLWLWNGDWLVALTANAAVIETFTGARQTYRRKPSEPGRVLAWKLVSGWGSRFHAADLSCHSSCVKFKDSCNINPEGDSIGTVIPSQVLT